MPKPSARSKRRPHDTDRRKVKVQVRLPISQYRIFFCIISIRFDLIFIYWRLEPASVSRPRAFIDFQFKTTRISQQHCVDDERAPIEWVSGARWITSPGAIMNVHFLQCCLTSSSQPPNTLRAHLNYMHAPEHTNETDPYAPVILMLH